MPIENLESDVVVIKTNLNTMKSDSFEIKTSGDQSVNSLVLIGTTLDKILLGISGGATKDLIVAMNNLVEALNRNSYTHNATKNSQQEERKDY